MDQQVNDVPGGEPVINESSKDRHPDLLKHTLGDDFKEKQEEEVKTPPKKRTRWTNTVKYETIDEIEKAIDSSLEKIEQAVLLIKSVKRSYKSVAKGLEKPGIYIQQNQINNLKNALKDITDVKADKTG